jgi:hypothetical protein
MSDRRLARLPRFQRLGRDARVERSSPDRHREPTRSTFASGTVPKRMRAPGRARHAIHGLRVSNVIGPMQDASRDITRRTS